MVLSLSAFAQDVELSTKPHEGKLRPVLSSDSHYSLFRNKLVSFWGFKLGLAWKRHEMGLGADWLQSDVYVDFPHKDNTTLTGKVNFRYINAYYEYTFFRKGRWDVDLPIIAIGTGRAWIDYNEPAPTPGEVIRQQRKGFLYFVEPSAAAYYRFLPYTSLGLGGGYRFAFAKDLNASKAFSAPIFIARIRINFGAMFRDIRRNQKRS